MIEFIPLGGGGEIGANSYYLNISGTGIILDCGMHPQKTGLDALPLFDIIKDKPIDYVLISHAHQDHIGSLPFLIQRFPYLKIITTPQTRAVAELTIHNTISILKEQINENEIKLYSHEDVDLLIQSIMYKSYGEEFDLIGYDHKGKEPVKAVFTNAGHIIGSAGILLRHSDYKIFYTGDISLRNQTLLKAAQLPDVKVDCLITETTYGSTDTSVFNWHKESERLATSINKVIDRSGSVLIPVFSLGKMQEIAATLWKLMQKGKLVNVDIYADGIGRKINRIYDYSRYNINYIDEEFVIGDIPLKSFYEIKRTSNFFKHPCIMLAASGMMMKKTASYSMAIQWLKHKESAIFTVGYMDPDTPGYTLAKARKGQTINFDGETIEVKCSIKNFRFPSHARREDILEIVKKLKPETIILVHGDESSIDWVGANILKNFKVKLYAAKIGDMIKLD